jgi:hypothetical protein
MKLDANLTPGAWHRTPDGGFTTTHKRTLLENQIRRHEIEITALSMASAKYFEERPKVFTEKEIVYRSQYGEKWL